MFTMQALTFAEVRALSDEDLIRLHDDMAPGTAVGYGFVVDEIARRRADRLSIILVRLTWVITVATIVNTILVAVSVILVATAD
jgi:hypothetical protein